MAWHDIDWGDFPTWLTAIATVAALIAAWRAVKASWAVLQLERKREDRAEVAEADRHANEERAEQADRVAAWIDVYEGPLIRNGSELPIYDVVVSVFDADGSHLADATVPVVPPGEQSVRLPGENGGTLVLGVDARRRGRVSLRFRDTAGRKWERDVNGVLDKVGVVVFGKMAATLPALAGEGSLIVGQSAHDADDASGSGRS